MVMRFREPSRIQPVAPAHLMKTFEVLSPLDKQAPPVRCEDADCDAYLHGFKVIVFDESDPVWQMRMDYFRNKVTPRCDRRFREYRDEHNNLVFEFEAGQQCFTRHARRRDDVYVVRNGDWRGNPRRERRVHKNPDHFVEEFQESVDTALTDKQKG